MDRLTTHFTVSRTFLVYAHCPNMVIPSVPFHFQNILAGEIEEKGYSGIEL